MVLLKSWNNNVEADTGDNAAFKSFMCKTKLVGERQAQLAPNNSNGILKNVTIAVPEKCLSNTSSLSNI